MVYYTNTIACYMGLIDVAQLKLLAVTIIPISFALFEKLHLQYVSGLYWHNSDILFTSYPLISFLMQVIPRTCLLMMPCASLNSSSSRDQVQGCCQ